jgi:hypothetical protein
MATLRTLFAPKEGNTEAQYEDAFAVFPEHLPESTSTETAERFTIAVADGASSAVFAREWARKLVGEFAAAGFPASDAEAGKIIGTLGRAWHSEVGGKATTWHAQEKMQHGSSATLLVVTWDCHKKTWESCSVGDVCIFLVRRNKLRFAFPLTKSTKFSDRPTLLTTEIGARQPMPNVTRYTEKYEDGDRFLLMSDAIAQHFLAEFEAKRKPWNDLPETREALTAYLKARRDSGALHNDDVTIVDLVI